MIAIIISLSLAAFGFLIWKYQKNKISILEEELKEVRHNLKSAYVKFGKSFEHFVPFIHDFPGNREKAVFLGMPIDFIVFDDDTIKFVETKTGNAKLNENQKRIKEQIENGRIEFRELRH